MSKKISFAPKPKTTVDPQDAGDKWVESRNSPPSMTPEKKIATKRLTLDIPEDLHQEIKIACAKRKTKMVDEITEILKNHYIK